jgi:ATP-dependent protease ClpP protease subunit
MNGSRAKSLFLILLALIFLVLSPVYARDDCDECESWEDELSLLTHIAGGKAFMSIYGPISTDDLLLHKDFSIIEAQDITEIEILINSPGGIAWAGFAIADAINRAEDNGYEIQCRAEGIVASIAIPILLACDKRSSGSNTIFMLHEASSAMQGNTSAFKAINVLFDLMGERYIDILVENTKIKDRSKWQLDLTKTTWFNAKTALEWGIVQRID